MKTYDLTKTISKDLAIWPGDQVYFRDESTYTVGKLTGHTSWIQASLHTGTHVDAHWHYNEKGIAIDTHDITRYIGKCQVVDVTKALGPRIEIADIKDEIRARKVLFKTSNTTDENTWSDDFKGVSVALIHYLKEQDVDLIGIDTPSVDVYNAEVLSAHQAFYDCDLYNIEGLILNDVPEGVYQLIAMPLKIKGGDGSPVRAVLQTLEKE